MSKSNNVDSARNIYNIPKNSNSKSRNKEMK